MIFQERVNKRKSVRTCMGFMYQVDKESLGWKKDTKVETYDRPRWAMVRKEKGIRTWCQCDHM